MFESVLQTELQLVRLQRSLRVSNILIHILVNQYWYNELVPPRGLGHFDMLLHFPFIVRKFKIKKNVTGKNNI